MIYKTDFDSVKLISSNPPSPNKAEDVVTAMAQEILPSTKRLRNEEDEAPSLSKRVKLDPLPSSRIDVQLLSAAARKKWAIVENILLNHPEANVNAAPLEEPNRGKSILWYAAARKKWDIVKNILQNHPEANVNAAPLEGVDRGKSVLWYAANRKKWDIVKNILLNHPKADVNAAPLEGIDRGKSILWYAAARKKWDIVENILQNHPEADVNAAPLVKQGIDSKRILQGATVFWLAVQYNQEEIICIILNNFYDADVNAAPLEGRDKGKSILWRFALNKRWEFVEFILENCAEADVRMAPACATHQSVRRLIEQRVEGDLLSVLDRVEKDKEFFNHKDFSYIVPKVEVAMVVDDFLNDPRLANELIVKIAALVFPTLPQYHIKFPSLDRIVDQYRGSSIRNSMVLIASSASSERGLSENCRRDLFEQILLQLNVFWRKATFDKSLRDRLITKLKELSKLDTLSTFQAIHSCM